MAAVESGDSALTILGEPRGIGGPRACNIRTSARARAGNQICDATGRTMSETSDNLENLLARGYQHGFVTDIEADTVPPGLDEDVVRLISRKKKEPAFLTEWRLKALRHWMQMREPHWAHVKF